MPDHDEGQPVGVAQETGIEELLKAHRAISEAWYSNWRAQQQARLDELLKGPQCFCKTVSHSLRLPEPPLARFTVIQNKNDLIWMLTQRCPYGTI
jgi:hypothetical protein